MTVTKNKTLLIAVVATVGRRRGYWMLALAPKREEAAKLEAQVATKQAELASRSRRRWPPTARPRATTPELRHGRPARQGRAGRRRHPLAGRPARRRGRRHATSTSARSRSAPAARPLRLGHGRDDRARRPRARSVGTAGFSAMPFTLRLQGHFINLSQFFARLERFVTLRNERSTSPAACCAWRASTLQVDPKRLPGHPRADRRQLVHGARDAGPHAGATPQGPAAATTAGTPAPAGGPTVPTTTATVPGATPMKPLENVWRGLDPAPPLAGRAPAAGRAGGRAVPARQGPRADPGRPTAPSPARRPPRRTPTRSTIRSWPA